MGYDRDVIDRRPVGLGSTALAIAAFVAISCAQGGEDPVVPGAGDAGDLDADDSPEIRGPGPDSGGSCALGSVDHCGTCETICPGPDNASTTRVCRDATASATCELVCHGDYYDVDGKLENGCEAKDDLVHDSPTTATNITLPNVPNDATLKSNPLNVVETIFHDTRYHDDDASTFPFGREDWFKVTAVGAGSPSATMVACLSAVNYPTDNELEVCISANNVTTFVPASCKSLVVTPDGGGGSQCVQPPGNPDTGTFYVRVKKLRGTATSNGYALFLNH